MTKPPKFGRGEPSRGATRPGKTGVSPAGSAASQPIEVMIEGLGQQGDGLAQWQSKPLYVPYTLPGERVAAILTDHQGSDYRARPTAILAPAAERVEPVCPHFGACGGCALQHLDLEAYHRWKRAGVITTLAQRGIELAAEPEAVFIPAGTRRRAVFAVIGTRGKCLIGFHQASSRHVIDLQQCNLLTAALFALVGALRETLGKALAQGEAWDLLVTECDNGIDILITAKAVPTDRQRFALADLAQVQLPNGAGASIGIARITWLVDKRQAVPEPIAQHHVPQVSFAGVKVDLPAQSFLQPSVAGEAALCDAVLRGIGNATMVADLYAGCGTFSFPLAKQARVIAVEGSKPAVAALNQAARRALVSDRISAASQDLDDAPLMPEQLKKIEAVVFDPPRAGARTQSEQIARSGVARAVGVSCNPATFARDARILIDGGFRLTELTIVDQFIWSPHVEVVGRFER